MIQQIKEIQKTWDEYLKIYFDYKFGKISKEEFVEKTELLDQIILNLDIITEEIEKLKCIK